MEVVTVREFDEQDRVNVIELWRVCGLLRSSNDPNLDIDRKLAVDDAMFFVAAGERSVVGSVMAGYDGHRGWVNYLAVDPEVQGSGIGRRLMERAEQHLHDVGCPKVNLQVRVGNPGAVEFYERMGFTVDNVVSMGKRLLDDTTPDRRRDTI